MSHNLTCDWDSSNSLIRDGSENYFVDMSISDCKEIYTQKYYVFEGVHIPITFNGTVTTHDIFEVGSLDSAGYCKSGTYELNGFKYSQVMVKNRIKIHLTDYLATANTDTNTILLRSGVTCAFSDASCMDAELGFSTWEVAVPSGVSCLKHGVTLLYQGPAQFIDSPHPDGSGLNETFLFVDDTHTQKYLALRLTGDAQLCNVQVRTTESSKIYVVEAREATKFVFENQTLLP